MEYSRALVPEDRARVAALEAATRGREFVLAAKVMLAADGNRSVAAEMAAAWRAGDRVINLVKAPISPGMLGTDSALGDYRSLAAGFVASLRNYGVFDGMLSSFINVPVGTRLGIATTGASGDTPAEAEQSPISALVLATIGALAPFKTSAIVVATAELAISPGTTEFLGNELKAAVAVATDVKFLEVATAAGIASQASAGATLTNVLADVGYLLTNVTTSARSKLFLITTPALQKKLSIKSDPTGGRAFPDLPAVGAGSIAGIPVLGSDAIPAGTVLLVDASGFVANSDLVALDYTRQADIDMQTAPDSPATASTVRTSLWQQNKRALRATRWWACRRLRDSAVARITGANY